MISSSLVGIGLLLALAAALLVGFVIYAVLCVGSDNGVQETWDWEKDNRDAIQRAYEAGLNEGAD